MTTTPTSGAADLPEALRSIQRFEVVDCIDDKHVPAVIPKPHGPWVRYEDHIAALAAGQATAAPAQPVAQQGVAYAAQQASTVTNYTTLGAAMRAIRQSIQMIGDPEDECMRAVKRVLRGAVIIVEDSGDEVAAPAAPAQPDPAYSAACHLATALFKKYFAHLPDFASGQAVWGLCGSTAGVISQIDNMVSGLLQPPTTAFSEDEL